MRQTDDPMCACGHGRDAHEHYRRGSDCGVCGREAYGKFKAQRTTGAPRDVERLSVSVRGGR